VYWGIGGWSCSIIDAYGSSFCKLDWNLARIVLAALPSTCK
jgi:hypothetical protein